ncbi:negative regulator of genetic competence MecA [Liquorilactobacillus sucicola DSM 21376 = JCM 15457]|uniref:Adapter protein MecA n=1 Tax=Liquorilactobacillus sucicola DSM 21376 = JCM 15457 TaxID=1423806 RepID=A0A023CVP9_9LACO|nr:adaptor protein MecA [Liquorilactobacillus sucicola]KRN06012.1 adaptor protein [Liquorilactobacillus sucicola DSM 21376 = JCM 15457]GAJ25937.1 negative regulator of genetic competence MecA [Liquorilactobacillus sucicola DSM 21376 = JCM 15457]
MEMEKINDNTIRVLLETEDLTERGITVLDLLGNHKEIESFFYSILEEVDVDHEFRENDAVTFQLLPNKNGLELFISKVDPKETKGDQANNGNNEGEEFSFLGANEDVSEYIRQELSTSKSKNKKKALENDGDGVSEYLKDKTVKQRHVVVEFDDFENFVQAAKILHNEEIASTLYLLDSVYYLDLVFFVGQASDNQIKDTLSLVVEYGRRAGISADVLQERGKKLLSSSALELARYYFK